MTHVKKMSSAEDQQTSKAEEVSRGAESGTQNEHVENLDASLKRALDIFRKYIWCIE